MNFITMQGCKAYLPAVLSGFLMTLAFPKTGLNGVAWLSLVPLMVSVFCLQEKKSPDLKKAFNMGLFFGMSHYLTLLYWLVNTLAEYGGLPGITACSILVLLCFYLSLYTALFCVVLSRMSVFSPLMPFQAAALWAGLEYLRSFLLTGFPWGLLGYSQYKNTLLIQVSDLGGVYAVSFAVVCANALLSMTVLWVTRYLKDNTRNPGLAPLVFSFVLILVGSGFLWGYGSYRIQAIDQAMADLDQKEVCVVQGNIKQSFKWDAAFKERTIDVYCALSREAVSDKKKIPDLIVWPETALPFYYNLERNFSARVDTCIRDAGTHFIIGSPAVEKFGQKYKFYNRALMMNPFSVITGCYDKIHLVPFGEYVPLGKYLSFLGKITAQAGNFTPGPEDADLLGFDNTRAGMLICFEIIFPSLSRNVVSRGADVLVTITNDAWFGQTSAPYQHFSMAVFRAVENHRAVVRSANTGISGFIDPVGRTGRTLPLEERDHLTAQVNLFNKISFYTRFGDVFALACLISGVATVLRFFVK